MEKKVKESKTLTEKAQIMKQVNDAMHKLLITDFPKYYKNIATDVIVTSKDGTQTLQRVEGYHLLFDKIVEIDNKQHKGYAICKPTTYVKGGNSYSCCYYKEVGKTTYNK